MKTLIVTLILAAAVVATIPAEIAAQERLPIIDMHMHADLPPHPVPAGAAGICRPSPCEGDGRATASHAQTLAETLEAR